MTLEDLGRAMQEPLRQIVANAGGEPSVVQNRISDGKGNFGFNAQTEEYGDLVKMGILDPTKVVRAALQNAASIAGLLITTVATVAEKPKKDDGPAMPPGAWGDGRHDVGWRRLPGPEAVPKATRRRGFPFAARAQPGWLFSRPRTM